jgi:hypothetical protein
MEGVGKMLRTPQARLVYEARRYWEQHAAPMRYIFVVHARMRLVSKLRNGEDRVYHLDTPINAGFSDRTHDRVC